MKVIYSGEIGSINDLSRIDESLFIKKTQFDIKQLNMNNNNISENITKNIIFNYQAIDLIAFLKSL